jgi:hypothetical protein
MLEFIDLCAFKKLNLRASWDVGEDGIITRALDSICVTSSSITEHRLILQQKEDVKLPRPVFFIFHSCPLKNVV